MLVLVDPPCGQLAAQDPREDIAVVIGFRGIDRHLKRTPLDRARPPATTKRMSDETPESLIPYDEIVQDALRAVVGRVLREVEQSGGLPGEHHFYITFKTWMPGVAIPNHLLVRFPDVLSIVMEHPDLYLIVLEDSLSAAPPGYRVP